MKYYFFLDESGDHWLCNINANFPYFILCGCLFSEEEKNKMERRMNDIKKEFFGTNDVIFHSRDIRKCEKWFQILFDVQIKKQFYDAINSLFAETNFTFFSAVIKKEEYIKKYGKTAENPYSISLAFLMERLIFCLDEHEKFSTVEIFVESRGEKEDRDLLQYFNRTLDVGTFFVDASRMKQKIKNCHFREKKNNDNGIQMADLCAYPIARNIMNPNENYPPFDVLFPKIYCKNGKRHGLKIFP